VTKVLSTAATGSDGDIDIHEVMRRLPHRPPFLMIDRAEGFVPNQRLVGVKMVTVNEPFFAGHFPGAPVMPGVLIIECMAQTGGLLMSKSWDVDAEGKIIFFMSVDNCRFRNPVRPGDVLKLEVEVTRQRGDIAKFKGLAKVDGKLCAEAEFAAMLVNVSS
jgi:3-hydroxyacyl-[acyl-carrier-protein] dehydratase